MLRTSTALRPLGPGDLPDLLALLHRDPQVNLFVR